jgi:hypothetical protein
MSDHLLPVGATAVVRGVSDRRTWYEWAVRVLDAEASSVTALIETRGGMFAESTEERWLPDPTWTMPSLSRRCRRCLVDGMVRSR